MVGSDGRRNRVVGGERSDGEVDEVALTEASYKRDGPLARPWSEAADQRATHADHLASAKLTVRGQTLAHEFAELSKFSKKS